MGALLIKNIGLLETPQGTSPLSGARQGDTLKLKNASVLIENGLIARVEEGDLSPDAGGAEIIDAQGALVTPGLVDCHTHLVFGGWRQYEVPLKLKGASYLDILRAGGGILSTVRHTREASDAELTQKARAALDEMLALGVTTAEAKSGYGLDLETELRQLEIARTLSETHPIDLVSTFLGAHAIPDEYKGRAGEFIDMLTEKVMPEVASRGLAEFADVFCEDSVFNPEESRRYLEAAKRLGLGLKIHADEIEAIGGAELAGELGAISAEHLIATGTAGMKALAAGGVIAALLPATSFYLNKNYAGAREMIGLGIPVAVASDYNPGSCPSYNLQFCINLAYLKYRMYPQEVLTAVTLNAACAIGRGASVGTLEKGKAADLVIWNAPDFETLCYRFGLNQARAVIKNGRLVSGRL